MKNGFWKRFLALVMAIVIVASTGVLDSAGWLLANSGETEPTQPATQETTAPAGNQQGSTETTTITVPPTSETTTPTGETTAPTGETTTPTGETTTPTGETTAPTGESSEPTGESTETTETTASGEVILAVVLQAAYTDGTAGYVIDSAVLTFGAGVEALTYEYAIPQVEGYTFSVPEMTLNTEGKYEITLGRPAESYTEYITVTYAPVSTEPTEPSEGDATEPTDPSDPSEPTEGEEAEGITVTVNANQIFIGGTQEETTVTLGSVTFGEEDTELTFSFSIPAVADHEAMVDSETFISTDGLTYSGTIARPEESTSITVDIYYRAVEGAQNQDVIPVVPTDHYTFYLDGSVVAEQIVKGEETVNAPASPEKDGHKFLGWNTAADGSGSYFTSTPAPSGATFTYYAVFEEVYYVFFVNDAGAVCATKEGVSGQEIAADITFPVDSDQSITGWYTDPGFNAANKVSAVTLTDANITLWAKVETGHWITYDSNGGNYIAPVFVHAEAATVAVTPTRLGYKFEGWFEDGAAEAFEFGNTLADNIALTAKWSANTNTKYTVIHWQENANDDEYSFFASEEKTGATGGETAATANSYNGFTVVTTGDLAWSQQTIAGDGSTIVNIYYSRNVYTIYFYPSSGASTNTTYSCGMEEHTHSSWNANWNSCYTRTCGNRFHSHSQSCYTLSCGKSEHTHNSNCVPTTSTNALFTITAKHGANISDQWPLYNNSSRWAETRGGSSYQNNIDVMPIGGEDYFAPSDSSTYLREVEYYVSVLPGETAEVTKGGVGYKIHHVDRSYGGSNTTVGDEDRYPIAGFTINDTHSSAEGFRPYAEAQFFYDRNTYTITFYNGNSIDSTASKLYEESIANVGYTPERPANVPEGYNFVGWYANKLMVGDPYDFAGKTMPAQALIFYAKWAPPTVSGTIYLTMQGDGAPQTIELKYGEKIDPAILPAYTVPDGYTDRGWALKEGDNYLPFNFDTVIYDNITLYPYYTTSATVQVFYDANGGTGTVTDSRKYADGSFADVKSASGLTNGDKVFLYWATEGGSEKYLPGDKIPMHNEDVTLYAVWGDVTEKAQLVYHNNDGTNKTDVHDNLLNNQLVVLKAGWTRDGYEFLGWSTNPGATSAEYSAGENYLVTNDNGVNNLYAVWKPTVFTVSYEYTGTVPTGAPEVPASYELTYGDSGTVAGNPTLDGYIFSGWETSNTTVTGGSFTMPATNVTFTGSWEARSDLSYTVKYNWNGTTVGTEPTVTGVTFGTTVSDDADKIPAGYALADGEPTEKSVTITTGTNEIIFNVVKVVTVKANDLSKVYGENDPTLTATVTGASANDINFSLHRQQGEDASTYVITVTGDIANERNGYKVTYVDGTFTITKRPITFTSGTGSKVYDGKALTNGTVTVGGQGLAFSDTVTFDVTGSQTNVGSSKNTFTYTLANEDNYTVTKTEGTLSVTAETASVTVTITENSGTFKYDGKSHEVTGYTVSISGSTVYSEADFKFNGDATVTGVNAGSYDMQLKASDFVNTNTNFTNVTFRIVDGKLNIEKRAISFTSATDSKEYDGTPLMNDEVTVGGDGFAEGEGAEFNVTGSQTLAGSSANSFEVIANAGTDLEGNYTVTKTEGTLTVSDRTTKYVITVNANSGTFDYNGKEHTVTGFQTLTFTENGQTYTVSGISASGARTNAGTGVVATSGTPVVKDAAGNDVTGQFTVNVIAGTITVNKLQVTLTSPSASQVYNGKALTATAATQTGFAAGEGVTITVTGSQTAVGSSANTFTYTANEGTSLDNYDITEVVGTLTVDPIEDEITVTIQGNADSKPYNGQAQTVTGYKVVSISNPLYTEADFSFTGTDSATRTDVGTTNMGLTAANFTNTNTATFTNVKFVVTDGSMTVTPINVTVTITGHNNTANYDGQAHTVTGYDVSISNPLYTEADFTFTGTASASRTDAGKTMMGLTAAQFGNNNDNFATVTFNVTDGYQEIKPIAVTVNVTGQQVTQEFDGTEYVATGYTAEASTALFNVNEDIVFNGTAEAKRTDVGTTNMGLTASMFSTGNPNFSSVTFNVTDGFVTITPVDAVVITITGNTETFDYNGQPHTVTGYTASSSNALYDVSNVTFSGTASVTRTDAGTTSMGLTADMFGNSDGNFSNVTFVIAKDGAVTVNPIDVTVTITGRTSTLPYDGKEHSVAGYTVAIDNDLYTEADFAFSGTAAASRTDAGKTMMGLAAGQFENRNANFATVTFVVTDGYQEITPIDVTVTIVGKNNTTAYDGAEHSVSGYDVSFSTDLYTEADFAFSGTAAAARTDAGKTMMGLAAGQFENKNANFANVTFVVTDGYQEITPIDVTVTIVGKNNTSAYDGTEHSVTGYDVTFSTDLYTEADFTFSGTAAAARTDVGTTNMNLAADQFENQNGNFRNVTFNVTDGYQTITPISVTVTITGHNSTVDYDGEAHSVSGYDVSISNPLYTEADFTFTGTAAAERTNAGTTQMGLAPEQFVNQNNNFTNVVFQVTDGYQTINPIDVTVTIVGKNNTTAYDGEAHTVTGYDVTIGNDLYTEADFTFTGTASASRTDAGTTYMGLAADQFENTNDNFRNVTFNVTDGYQTITSIDVTVTITGHTSSVDYDGGEHIVTGYDVSISNPLYTEADFTFSGKAEAKRTDAGKTIMGLAAGQFANTNNNFANVTFVVTDGYQEIKPINVTVTITGHNDTTDYDGQAHTVTGYDVSISNPLYTEADFTFSGTASASRTDAGTTNMGLAADQFANTNSNFAVVTFNVTDGYQTIDPIDVTVTITEHGDKLPYDGTEHTVTGYDVSISNPLYTEADFSFDGTASVSGVNAGNYDMTLTPGDFTNLSANFENVTFVIVDGQLVIDPINVTVTITGHNNTTDYDGQAHTVTGYEVEISDSLYTEADFTFTGTASASRTDAGTTNMGLAADQFVNNNANFETVTFVVTDGYQTVSPIDVTVTVVGANATVPYDGQAHTAAGYTAQASTALYDVDNDIAFTGTASATRTDAGTTKMGLAASQFANTNPNFASVTFNVTDGYVTVTPIDVTVTIVGNNNTTVYDGEEHTVTGYEATFSTDLYTEADFSFTGEAVATRTEEGTTQMGLEAGQFANTNNNFATVTFNVTDGYQTITPVDAVVVTIVGATATNDYDGSAHTVTGYTATSNNPLYDVDTDFTFSGSATASRTDVGTTYMGLDESQFVNTNGNFAAVTFVVTDGYQEITPIDVTVTIVGATATNDYDGSAHTVTGYTATANSDLYNVDTDFTFSGTDSATRTDAGKTMMGLKADQFVNTNANFATVTFVVTDGYQEITPIDVTVTIVGANATNDYDGTEHTVTGYTATASTTLYDVDNDFTFSGNAEAKRTVVGTTYMGLAASQFANTNANFANVTFQVTDGYQTIEPITVTVTITENGDQVDYDGTEHTVTGYTVEISDPLYTEADFSFSGTASVSGVNAGSYDMTLTPDDFTNLSDNFENVTFVIVDGQLVIDPIDVTVTITEHSDTVSYDGTEHTVTGYDVEISDPLYTEADFTFSGNDSVSGVNAGTYDMGLTPDDFANTNPNFENVTFVIVDGQLVIDPIDVTVTIVGNNNTTDYDGQTHTVTGYVATASTDLYDVDADIAFTGEARAFRTDAGTTYMQLKAGQFSNTNPNFRTVTFNVTDGYQEITPIDVTVTIVGNNNETDYDGEEHTVTGYEATASTDLYDVNADFTFSGNATASRTDVGTTNMGLEASMFANTNGNFRTVTFEVTDGYQTIDPIDVTVTIVGNNNTTDYDGGEHTVTGYEATASTALYDVDADFTFSGNATASRTDVGTTNMGLAASQFANTNPNFRTVTFEITDGYQTINPIDVTVTIVGNNNTTDYDGEEHTVTGYEATASTALYDVNADFTFSGNATASRTNAGTTNMGLAPGQFANTNPNFRNVTFEVTDGYQTVNPIDVTVTIVGSSSTVTYDGEEHTVTGYEATASTGLYDVNADFTFSGEATATRTEVGTTYMGLAASQFANTNGNFATVTFEVTDGYQTINPLGQVVVTIVGNTLTVDYDGQPHTVTEYVVEDISDPLYTEADFTFSGIASATRTDVGTTNMGLDASQFANINDNFSDVTFEVTDGWVKVDPIDVTVTIVGNTSSVPYDGTVHTASGYVATASTDLYDVNNDFTFSGTATAPRMYAGTTYMGLKAEQFANTNPNFATVTFNVTDGYQEITPIDITVTIVGNTDTVNYDGETHTVTGYEVTAISDPLFTEDMIIFSGDATVSGVDADTYYMGISAADFSEANDNFRNVTFNVTDGWLTINPIDVVVTVVGNNDTADYDGEEHTVTGYVATANTTLYDVAADFTFSGEAVAKRTDAGTTMMGLAADQFVNTNGNFANVTFVVTDGYQKIDPIDVTVTIVGASDTSDYDGEAHTVNGYVATASTDLYDVNADFTFSGTATASRTDVGTTYMGLAADQFVNTNPNFATVTFNVTDGYQTIGAIDVTVIITENSDQVDYDGKTHEVVGYTVSIGNPLYTEADFTFSGDASVSGVDAGNYDMTLTPDDFTNTNPNFANVTFEIVDGQLVIDPIDVTVTIVGESNTTDYDGEAHTVTGYVATASTDLYDVNADFTFSGNATATQTNVGTANMGLAADQFVNTNPNFRTVTFEVTDGYQTIEAINVEVTIVGAVNTITYDGQTHTVTGYTAEASTELYDVTADFTFSGNDTASQLNVGTTYMGLAADQFANTNPNFATVTFNVTDGYQTVTKRPVTLTSADGEKEYDGTVLKAEEVTVSGDLFVEGEGVSYSGFASITAPGTVDNTFTYTVLSGTDLDNYEITVEEGTLTVNGRKQPFVIEVTANSGEKMYDGTPLTVSGILSAVVESTGIATIGEDDAVTFTLNGATFTLTGMSAEETQTDVKRDGTAVGSYDVVVVGEHTVTDSEGNNVTSQFTVTTVNGQLTITPRTVVLTSADDTKEYDGTALTNSTVTVSEDGFAQGEGAAYDVTGSQTLIGSSENTFTYTLNEGTLAANYEISTVNGTLTVTLREDGLYDDVVDKTYTLPDGKTEFALGDTVVFDITVTNVFDCEATVTLTEQAGVTWKDNGETVLTGITLAAGESKTFQAEYVITEADILAGEYTNTVNVEFTSELGTIGGGDDVTVPEIEAPNPELTLVKTTTSEPANGEKYDLGETITYEIVAENTGNVTLTDVEVYDTMYGGVAGEGTLMETFTVAELAPGQKATFTFSYTVTEADLQTTLTNEATGSAKNPSSEETEVLEDQTEDVTADIVRELDVEKTLMNERKEVYGLQTILSYEIVIRNLGNVTEYNVVLEDQMNGAYKPEKYFTFVDVATGEKVDFNTLVIPSIAPGEAVVIRANHQTTAADESAVIWNTVYVSSDDITEPVTAESEKVTMQTLYALHIFYMDENWQIIAPGHYSRRAEGDQFSVKSPEVEGYVTTTEWVVSGKDGMPAEDVYIYVIYTKLPEETTEPEETTTPTDPTETEPTEPTYDLTPLPDEEVPMGDVHLGEHTCCIMHFLIMLVAMILLACYTSDRKKYQKRIFEMKKSLAAEEAGKTGMEEIV